MSEPFAVFSNDELKRRPRLEKGQAITCPRCKGLHDVFCGKDEQGNEIDILLFYKCGDKLYLAGVGGKCIV